MKYEITYKKTSEHEIDIEAESIPEAYVVFQNIPHKEMDERERICNSDRKVTSVSEEEH